MGRGNTMKVLTVDPGKVTGFALGQASKVLQAGERNWNEFLALAESWLPALDLIIYERFDFGQETLRRADREDALCVIGTLCWWAKRDRISIDAYPRGLSRILPDERLAALGLHRPGQGHANDALRLLAKWQWDADIIKELP